MILNGDLSQILINRLDKTYELYNAGKYGLYYCIRGKVYNANILKHLK